MAFKSGKCPRIIKENTLMLLNIAGIIVGLVIGFGIREVNPSKDTLMWIGLPGELFIRMLRMLILPLIVCSVIAGSASMDLKSNGKISLVVLIFIVVGHLITSCIGVALTILLKPGVGGEGMVEVDQTDNLIQTQDIFADLLRNLVPNNLVEATFRQAQTQYSKLTEEVSRNGTNGTIVDTIFIISKSNGFVGGVNVLGLIAMSTLFGAAVSQVKVKAAIFLQFFVGATEVILIILRCFFWVAPLGIASLIVVSIAPVQDITDVFSRLGWFVLSVTIGLFLYQFIILPTIFYVFTRNNPFKFMLSTIRAILLAFASTSVAVAIPEMLEACDKNNIDQRLSKFVIPLSVTLSADGSVLYITSATIFITQLSFGTVTPSQAIVTILLTAICGTAIPPIPSASIVTIIIILTSLNVPITQVVLLFAVEWFLDRIRTQCNAFAHTTRAAIAYSLCRKNLTTANDDGETVSNKNNEFLAVKEDNQNIMIVEL